MIYYPRRSGTSPVELMNREELITAILGFGETANVMILRAWLEQQPTSRLRRLLIAVRVRGGVSIGRSSR